MNTNFNIGSSETTREAPYTTEITKKIVRQFTFTSYISPEHKKNISFSFLEWFIGFSEGNGYFCSRIANNNQRLSFEIIQKDAKLMYKIRTTLGFGKVSFFIRNNETYWKYSVEDKKGLQRIMLLFNGNLVLPKKYAQFIQWITLGQSICPKNFVLKKQIVQVSLETGWLSGFIEAEGCFYAIFRLNLENYHFYQKLTLTQQDTHGEFHILQEIAILLKETGTLHLTKKPNYFKVSFNSLKSQAIIVFYINKFPLLGNKNIVFHRWWRIYLRRQNCKFKLLTLKEKKKLKKLCSEINKTTNM